VALLYEGWLLIPPYCLNIIDLVTIIEVHETFKQVHNGLGLHARCLEMALLQVLKEPVSVSVPVEQPLQLLLGDLWLLDSAEIELVKVSY
jgi:hypothetical protein